MGLESEDARISLASAMAAFGRPPRPVLCASHPPFTNERHAFSELNRFVRFKIKAIIFQQYAKYRQRNKQKSSHNRLTMQPNSIQNPEKCCPGVFRNGSWKKMVPEATWEQSGSRLLELPNPRPQVAQIYLEFFSVYMVYRYTGKKRNGRYIETEIDTKQIAENAKMLRRRGNEHRIRTNLASKPFKKYCILKSDGMAQGWSQQPAERSRKSAKRKPNEAPNMKPKGAKMAPRKCGILPRIDREIKIQSGATKNDTKLHQMDPRGCQNHPNGSQLAPEGGQREPKGT